MSARPAKFKKSANKVSLAGQHKSSSSAAVGQHKSAVANKQRSWQQAPKDLPASQVARDRAQVVASTRPRDQPIASTQASQNDAMEWPAQELVIQDDSPYPKHRYTPSPDRIVVRLKIERRSRHPWVYAKMIEKPANKIKPGSVVEVMDATDHWVGRGFYNAQSQIALRIMTDDPSEELDLDFFVRRIGRAIAARTELHALDQQSNAYRLVHAEGDDLSGLIIDRFQQTFVLEYFSAGMWLKRDLIRRALDRYFPGAKHFWFADEHIASIEGFDATAPAPPAPVPITEHGLQFMAAPGLGHKTGFFADQRDTRLRLASYCHGKRVLDLCCNTGGFAIYAKAKGGAKEVLAIDIDAAVLQIAEQNARLNQSKIRFVQADIFAWLRDAARHLPEQPESRFDVVVLDPAKMTRDRDQVIAALKKYLDMNKLALAMVKPGGILLSCSCTGLVSEAQFLDMLRRAALYAGRHIQVFHVSGAGPDHPFLAHVPEGRYLKAVFCRVF